MDFLAPHLRQGFSSFSGPDFTARAFRLERRDGIEPSRVRDVAYSHRFRFCISTPRMGGRVCPSRFFHRYQEIVMWAILLENVATVSRAMVTFMPISKSAVFVGSISMVIGVPAV